MEPLQLSRRDFLHCAARAAGGIGVLTLPMSLWRAHAQSSLAPRAERILIINLVGGIRSSAAFHASGDEPYNPWGVLGNTGALRLGKLLGDAIEDARLAPGGAPEVPLPDAAYVLGPDWEAARLPRIAEAASGFSVLGTWNERRGDHATSQIEETTGGTRNDPGILTRIHVALASTLGAVDVPPFTVAVDSSVLFGVAPGASVPFAPVQLANSRELPGESRLPPQILGRVGTRWTRNDAMFEHLDQIAVGPLAGPNRLAAEAHAGLRRNLKKLGTRLAEPWMDLEDGAAAFGQVEVPSGSKPLSNAMLLELITRGLGPDPDDPAQARPLPTDLAAESPFARDVSNLALAVRLLQLGAPAVVVEFGNFDFHGDERTLGPARYRTVARWWASLWWLLSRLSEPTDAQRRMIERTLVVTMSDFGRDPAANRGFNDGEGSDHGNFPSCYYLAHAVMGAGVRGGRVIGEVETNGAAAYDARLAAVRFGTERFLATLLDALGLDPISPTWGFPTSAPVGQLWEAV